MAFLLLMPSYNQARYIGAAIASVLAQDDPDWELWIVDNSTDETPAVVAQFTDPRIRFHHIARRMDPGSCLNWMLARAQGRDFSYVHTDNNLLPGYVRVLRAALAATPLALAYCDMKEIDAAGRRTAVIRRGAFDLPRMLSLGPLGVPFAATTALAHELGGFATGDIADDVRFCTLAWGVAQFAHVREPLLDYRLHGASRTQGFGGVDKLRLSFLRTHASVLPELERRGLQPLEAMAQAIRELLDDLDWQVEDLWCRRFARRLAPWWEGEARVDPLFQAGLLRLPGWRSAGAFPLAGNWGGRWHAPWTTLRVMLRLRSLRPALRRTRNQLRDLVLPWAWLRLQPADGAAVRFRVQFCDSRTLWAARLLQDGLGWQPHLDPAARAPGWLRWPAARGDEPLLDLSAAPRFVTVPS
ncbi:MAG TPA: glycosyltransferase family A protein [Solimonas sp.]|nr:glycosyltransferase family A protein [Solimonas sp.]